MTLRDGYLDLLEEKEAGRGILTILFAPFELRGKACIPGSKLILQGGGLEQTRTERLIGTDNTVAHLSSQGHEFDQCFVDLHFEATLLHIALF